MRATSKYLKLASFLLAGTAPVTALHAQQPAPPAASDDGGTIIVLGRGLTLPPGTPAYGAITLDRDRLNSAASGGIESALMDVAGFQEFRRSDSRSSNPSSQGVTLRALGGNATSRALVLLDGVPQADPFFGSIPFNALLPERLGAVRVTRGGGAGAFGAGTVAGTIEMFSADRAQLPEFQGSGFYGSRNSEDVSGAFSPNLGGGFVSISGKFSRGDGFNTTPVSQQNAATVPAKYRTWSAGLYSDAPVGADGEIQSRVTLFQDERTLRFAGAENGQEGQDASLRFISRGKWQIDALVYGQLRNFNNIVISSTSFKPTLNQRNTPSTGLGGKLELRPPVGADNVLRIGVDSRYAQADMYEDAVNASSVITTRRSAAGQQVTSGAYMEDDWTLGPVVLTGGARADHWAISHAWLLERNTAGTITKNVPYNDRDGWEGSFRAGMLWHAAGGLDLRAAGYTSFRVPTLNELYRSFTVFPVTTNANPDLSPERLKGAEVGLDFTPSRALHFSATFFYNALDNAIANVTIGTNLRQRQNVDAIIAKGIELSGSLKEGPFDLVASYALNDSRVKASGAGVPLNYLRPAQSPRHVANATLGWTGPDQIRVSTTVRYVGPQFEDDLQTDVLKSTTTVDGYVRVPVGHGFGIVGRAENIFDATVMTRNQGGSIDLGSPRTFWIGVTFGG